MLGQRLAAGRVASRSVARTRTMTVTRAEAASAVTTTAPPTPKTGHHTMADDLKVEALGNFFNNPEQIKCTRTTGGVNNVCEYVDTPEGERYILRIYNNGNRTDKVIYEHEVLRQLQLQQDKLSFQVPKAKLSKTGSSHAVLSNGASACIFHIIPGGLAKTTTPMEVGRATGELCSAMAHVKMDVQAPQPRYYDLFKAHWAMDRDLFYKEVETNPGFAVCREAIDYLTEEIRAMEKKLDIFEASGLAKQVIHADLHFDNVMVVGDRVSGLLDFEFCVYDWRAMEAAVALSKYVGEAEPLRLCAEFCEGYGLHGELSQEEINIMPDLVNLRIFSNVIYFTGRALAKEDSLDSLTSRAAIYAKRVKWVNENRQAIVDAITERMNSTKKN